MSPATNLPEGLAKEDNGYVLKLNKEVYKEEVVRRALEEDKDWVKEVSSEGGYYQVKLETGDMEDVLNWASYLIYINKG